MIPPGLAYLAVVLSVVVSLAQILWLPRKIGQYEQMIKEHERRLGEHDEDIRDLRSRKGYAHG